MMRTRNYRKRVSWFMALGLLIMMVLLWPHKDVQAATGGRSREQAVSWVRSKLGSALDYDGMYGAQCVDLIDYYYEYLGQAIPWGNANQFYNGGKYCPSGWSYQNYPAAGSIAVWTGGTYGHVAVVTAVSDSTFTIVEQNYAGKMYCTERSLSRSNHDVTVFIHPDFAPSTYNINLQMWAWGFKNKEGDNGGKDARLLGTTVLKGYKSGDRYNLYPGHYTATAIPRGFSVLDTWGSGSYASGWKSYKLIQDYVTHPNSDAHVQFGCNPITYKITYNLNGGTNASSNPSTYNVLYGVTFANPTRAGYTFAGWTNSAGQKITGINPGANANHSSGADLINKLSSRTIGDQTVTANWKANTFALDVNGKLDGKDVGNVNGFATFDVYLNGNRVANDVTDYYNAEVPYGTSYRVTDIKPLSGKAYDGVANGSVKSTVTGYTNIRLKLHTVDAQGFIDSNKPEIQVYNGHTYYYYAKQVTWYDAYEVAKKLGGYLATISSVEENSFIHNLGKKKDIWIGLNDRDNEGVWVWSNGETSTYRNWESGQPDNNQGFDSAAENYVHLWDGKDGRWNDRGSYAQYSFVVEFDEVKTYNLYLYNNYSERNYLIDSDFASGSLNTEYWQSRNTDVATLSVDTTQKHNGYNSLKITNHSQGGNWLGGVATDLAIKTIAEGSDKHDSFVGSEKDMTLSFWAKSSQNGTKIYFRWGYEENYRSVSLTTEWKQYMIPMNRQKLFGFTIHPYVDRIGTVWLAELQLEDGNGISEFVPEPAAPVNKVSAQYGSTIPNPQNPTREGYVFKGWYTAASGGSQVSFPIPAKNSHFNLYARWEKESYNVSYEANGGSDAPAAQTKAYGKDLALSSAKPTRSGYTFQGWAASKDGSVAYQPGDAYKANKAVTLYAVWKIRTYKVKFDANGGEGTPSAQTKTYGKTLTLSSTAPTRSGYTFQGWATSVDGSVEYQPGDAYKANKAVTLYAVWKINTYKVKFNANGGEGAPSAQTKTYGKTLTLSSTVPTRSGYTFQGWATSKTGSASYHPGGSYKTNKAVTLYAVWKKAQAQELLIHLQPHNTSAYVDELAQFSVSATGSGLRYEWQYSGDNGKTWKSWDIFEPNLSVEVKAHRNNYLFRCVITDANGKTLNSNTAKLTVKSKITKQPVNQTCYEDETVPFTITATGPGLKYKWQFSRDGGANWSSWHTLQNIDVKAFGDRHGYLFRCIITDENGVTLTSKTVKLSINSKMIAQPKNVSVVVGGEAQFSVKASGPVLRYKWYMSKDNGKSWSYWAGRPSFSTTAVAARNGYLFKCEITGANDQTLNTKTVKLTVLPKISKQPADQSVALGKDAVFQAGAQGAGLQYKWYMSKDEGNTWNYYAAGSKLTVTGTKNRNGYLFRCEITDANGKVLTSNTARLTVK